MGRRPASRIEMARGANGLYAPIRHTPVTHTSAIPAQDPLGPPLSFAEAREAFERDLIEGGHTPEEAKRIAYETSVRVCRKEGFKL